MVTEKRMNTRKQPFPFFYKNLSWIVVFGLLSCMEVIAFQASDAVEGDDSLEEQEKGAWYTPPLPSLGDRMQAVHSVLLPNGKVLMVNGSSNRNRIENNEILDGVDVTDYATVNNTAIFDPEAPPASPGITRIGSPNNPDEAGESTDLFCSGHIHLWNGNVLFVSGTRFYYPPESFRGHKNAVVFDPHFQFETVEATFD